MSFTKPYTYTDGTVIDADGHEANEEEAKVYVNQDITRSDIQDNTLDTTDFATPRFISVGATGDFVSKTIQGNTDLQQLTTRAYFTSTAKLNRQNKKDALNFQAIPNAGEEVFVDRSNAYFIITCFVKVVIVGSSVVGGNNSNGDKLQDNLFALQVEDVQDGASGYLDLCTGYAFDPNGTYDAALSDQDPDDGGQSASHRTMTLQYRGLINGRGRKRFQLVASAKSDIGFVTCKSFIVETFYT